MDKNELLSSRFHLAIEVDVAQVVYLFFSFLFYCFLLHIFMSDGADVIVFTSQHIKAKHPIAK